MHFDSNWWSRQNYVDSLPQNQLWLKDVESKIVVGGNPARFIKKRVIS